MEILRALSVAREEIGYVSVSIARGCGDMQRVRSLLRELGLDSYVVVKIETESAVENLEELAECSDYVVVAGGGLGLHYGVNALPVIQRRVVYTSLRHGKPVAVATH